MRTLGWVGVYIMTVGVKSAFGDAPECPCSVASPTIAAAVAAKDLPSGYGQVRLICESVTLTSEVPLWIGCC